MGAATHSCDFFHWFFLVANALYSCCAFYAHVYISPTVVVVIVFARSIFGNISVRNIFSTVFSFIYFLIFFASLSERHTMTFGVRAKEEEKKMKDDEEGKTRKRINSDAKGSLDGTIFTYIYASDDAIEDDDDGDDNDDNVSRVPLKNINAIISMMMINAFVAPHRALPLAVSAFFLLVDASKGMHVRTPTTKVPSEWQRERNKMREFISVKRKSRLKILIYIERGAEGEDEDDVQKWHAKKKLFIRNRGKKE